MSNPHSQDFINSCRNRLLKTKQNLLNRSLNERREFNMREFRGDEIEKTLNTLAEQKFLWNQQQFNSQLQEIEAALGRIEGNIFGVCEETGEPIEQRRLLAVPWTRLSIEGAELRESIAKKFAR